MLARPSGRRQGRSAPEPRYFSTLFVARDTTLEPALLALASGGPGADPSSTAMQLRQRRRPAVDNRRQVRPLSADTVAMPSAVGTITEQVRARVRRDGVDLSADRGLAARYVREDVQRYAERSLGSAEPMLGDEPATESAVL